MKPPPPTGSTHDAVLRERAEARRKGVEALYKTLAPMSDLEREGIIRAAALLFDIEL